MATLYTLDKNKIGLAADPNFSGPLTGTETVRMLDISGNLIHEFRASEAGNDEVRLVDGAVSYEFSDENVAMTVNTGNVDTTQTANGALYAGQTLIGTNNDSDLGPLTLGAGDSVQMIDDSEM